MVNKKRDIPRFSRPLIETHCHLDYLKEIELLELIKKTDDLNIEKIITISVEPENLDEAFQLSQNYQKVYCTQGVHPHEARKWTEQTATLIQKRLEEKKVVAVGEIGLDYYYDHSPRQQQQEVFERQLQIAVDHNKPVVIHSRDADEDTQRILAQFSGQLKRKGVIHSYTSGMKLAEFALQEGFYLGFNGIMTFKNAQNVRDVLHITPLEQILLETDSPFLAPVPMRGRENNPSYLPFVADFCLQERSWNEDALEKIYQNSLSLFSLI